MSIGPTHPSSDVRVRFEELDDIPAIREVNRAAFRHDTEARIVDALRSAGAVILSMVAVIGADQLVAGDDGRGEAATIPTWGGEGGAWGDVPGGAGQEEAVGTSRVIGGTVIGHALVTPVRVTAEHGEATMLGLGPVAVHPDSQGQGVGTVLVEACLEQARESGYPGIVVLGNPSYYSRFGFIPAARWGLRYEIDASQASFLALELSPGKLSGTTGVVHYRPEFIRSADL